MNEIIIYDDPDITKPVQVTLEGETVWLTQEQMAMLFGRERSVIAKHLRNIFKEGELIQEATCAKFAQVQTEGRRRVQRDIDHYNLDAIISVGYRVNSKRGVRFRQWATSVLRQHLLQGYTLDQRRLAERGLDEARAALDLLSRTLEANALVSDTGRAVLELVRVYARTWRLLLQYDEDSLRLPDVSRPSRGILDIDQANSAIEGLKADLLARGEATDLFGLERGHGLAAILGAIEQTMFGEPLYPSREIKAAHLLYFVIKDHPFSDGNKRIGSFLFLLYLHQEGMASRIGDAALTALALLVAESLPANKDLLIRLIVNLLLET
ncbi:virulence protein RhuM/Fic/DOC family protein [Desulfonatronum thioautotrophicum]|uniref:virulence protein RhuM/Fic/DOC family protein n=1 Tax=Desulfonatronum thioautotrophicum TaxID=617001 RepID=UPI0005EB5FA7|nr:virulence protein RhuM/Fic/DOC family protein [Desulfonatronum thioautotrophicum]